MNKNLLNIYTTIFLSIFAGSFIVPVFPFLVREMGYADFYTGLGFSLYFIGMFFWGILFGKVSDSIGRKKTLLLSIIPDIIGYTILFFSGNILFLLLSRLFMGVGWGTFPVGQAYISDISSNKDKTKNLALTGAIFGIAFTVWPSLWGIIYEKFGIYVVLVPIFLLLCNIVSVSFLQEPKKDTETDEELFPHLHNTKKSLLVLFSISFLLSLGFSNIQITFPLYLKDIFDLSEGQIGYILTYVWICAITYQWFAMKYVRRFFSEIQMIFFWSLILVVWFFFFGINSIFWLLFFIIPLMPIGNGSLSPAIGSLVSQLAKKEGGKALGISTSVWSLGSIFGWLICGSLYHVSPTAPYIFSSIIFIIIALVSFHFLLVKKLS